jgi:RNA polymerase sigma factor (TIGR02999 family)
MRERSDHTLSTMALVHETYLKLADMTQLEWQDRAHFFAVASTAMRRILVSYARMHRADKRWGKQVRVSLDDVPLLAGDRIEEILAVDQALEGLAALNPRLSQTVELRFFGGLTIEETAEVLDVAPSTVKLYWVKARAWLYRELQQ